MVKSGDAYSGPTATRTRRVPVDVLKPFCRLLGGLAVLAVGLSAAPGEGQRIQFASPDTTAQPVSTTTAIPVQAASPYPSATPVQPMPYNVAPAAPATPALAPAMPAAPVYAPAPVGALPAAPPGATGFGPAPATLNGTIQPPPPTWDPYAPAGAGVVPGAILPQTPVLPPGAMGLPAAPVMPEFVGQAYRFLQGVSLDYHWFAGNGSIGRELGLNEVDVEAHFALPVLYAQQAPLVISPGFTFNFWSGPKTQPPVFADLPAQTYDAYLDAAWCPKITPVLSAELDARVGVYSDFKVGVWDMVRVTGKGLGVVNISPDLQFKLGVEYFNLVNLKLLPAGGFVWVDNPQDPNVRFDVLFPNPKFTQRLQNVGYTEWWWYVSGNYGGDTWVVKRAAILDNTELVSYSDSRVALGLEFKRPGGMTGLFEGGYSFSRDLTYRLPPGTGLNPNFYPSNAFFLRAGLTY